jgi:alanine-glyoxylate transaminase/(R)-3-amino-2-methylpropionate-pyruvate transaminase
LYLIRVVLTGKGGHWGQVFRIKPPMCISKEDADLTAQVLEEAIAAVEANLFS